MKTFEQLAQEAYAVFLATEKLQGRSAGYATWQTLPPEKQRSWITATRHIVEQANQVH